MYICIMDIEICYILETHFVEHLIMNVLFGRFDSLEDFSEIYFCKRKVLSM